MNIELIKQTSNNEEMEIETRNNITTVSYDSTINKYIVKDIGIDVIVTVDNMTAVKVTGEGSKKLNSYLKGLVEKYIENEIELSGLKADAENIVNTIKYTTNNKITAINIVVSKNEYGKNILFLTLNYEGKKIIWIEIDMSTMEIINNGKVRNEEIYNKFLNMYNKVFLDKDIATNETASDSITNSVVTSLSNNNKLEAHKQDIINKCNEVYERELKEAEKVANTENRREYVKDPLYHFASDFITTLSYNYFNLDEPNIKYKGRHLKCKDCKYCEGNGDKRTCSKISNSNIQMYSKNDICKYFDESIKFKYDSNKYNSEEEHLKILGRLDNITYTDWKAEKIQYCTFDNYIEFLNKVEYIDYKGDSRLHLKTNTLYLNGYAFYIPIDENYLNLNINDSFYYTKQVQENTGRRKNKIIDTNNIYKIG